MAKHTAKAMHTTIGQGRTKSRSTAALGSTGSGGRKMVVKTTGAGGAKVRSGSPMSTGKLGAKGQPKAAGARGFNYGKQGSKGGGASNLTKAFAGRAKGSGPYAKRNTSGRPAAR